MATIPIMYVTCWSCLEDGMCEYIDKEDTRMSTDRAGLGCTRGIARLLRTPR